MHVYTHPDMFAFSGLVTLVGIYVHVYSCGPSVLAANMHKYTNMSVFLYIYIQEYKNSVYLYTCIEKCMSFNVHYQKALRLNCVCGLDHTHTYINMVSLNTHAQIFL